MNQLTVLSAISFTEPSDFNEFCRGLGKDCPAKGDTADWRELFSLLNECEQDGLVIVERSGRSIESVTLTDAGATLVRAQLDNKRGLFATL